MYSLLLGAEPLEVTSPSVGLEGVELLNAKGPEDERRDVRCLYRAVILQMLLC